MQIQGLKKNGVKGWWRIYITSDFSLLKDLPVYKNVVVFFLCVCMYKMKPFSIKTWNDNGVEALKHDGKKWINEKHLGTVFVYKNLTSNKTQY